MITPHICTREDLARVLAPQGHCLRFVWTVTAHGASLGPSYALREGETTFAVGGFCHSAHVREVWSAIAPAAAARMGEILKAARLTLLSQCHFDPRPVVAFVRSAAGVTIARRLGFKPTKDCFVWIWRPQWQTCSAGWATAAAAS